jgi:hypothetical protein
MSLFALPVIGGAGLGNELFPWARAELFARRANVPLLAPQWKRFRIGPYVRREPEKRRYGGFFRSPEHVHGLSRAAIGAFGRRLREAERDSACARAKESGWPYVVRFEGIGDLFAPLANEHAFVRQKLWEMTRAPLRDASRRYDGPFIAMHVRRGDLTRQGFTQRELLEVKQFTPLSWFVAMAHAVRRSNSAGRRSIVVFTDGSPEEIADLLAIDGVLLHHARCAITDLWTMTRAATLFASGFSTFGMWASYLGGMPTIYAPGKLQQRVQTGLPDALEVELAAGETLPDRLGAESSTRMATADE